MSGAGSYKVSPAFFSGRMERMSMGLEYDVAIYLLSAEFFAAYPESLFPELMHKEGRPYACLLINTHCGYFICIPFRSSINHKNAYLFSESSRSRRTRSGLDYSKMAIIQDKTYIDSVSTPVIDQDEYTEMMRNISEIVRAAGNYVDTYIGHIRGTSPLHQREYTRKYQFSTLPYFHDILKLT